MGNMIHVEQSIVIAECCLSPALKYHGLDYIPMDIIRYCGSEPKVNQCLKHLPILDTKSFIFCIPSLHLVWIKMRTAEQSCCVIVAQKLSECGFVFSSLAHHNRVHHM